MPNYTWLWCIKRKQVNKQAVKILREKTDLKLACTGALQNNSVVCSGPRLLPVMKLHGSDKLGGIAVNVYKEHLLTLKIFTSAISSCEYKVFMKHFSHSQILPWKVIFFSITPLLCSQCLVLSYPPSHILSVRIIVFFIQDLQEKRMQTRMVDIVVKISLGLYTTAKPGHIA